MDRIRFAILTVSDRSFAGLRVNLSGPALAEAVENAGWEIIHTDLVRDDFEAIREALVRWCDEAAVDVILTSGGTGFGPRDITPEATKSILEREAPGLCEAMRLASAAFTPHAMLSRAAAGIRGKTLIVNFPGSPKAAAENFNVLRPVLPHAVALLRDDPSAEQGHAAPVQR